MNERQAAIKQAITDALEIGDGYHIATICAADRYALQYLISVTIKQSETINHIKNILED